MNRNNNILENTYFNLSKAGKLYRVLKSKVITQRYLENISMTKRRYLMPLLSSDMLDVSAPSN
jgi:hypothetical protein